MKQSIPSPKGNSIPSLRLAQIQDTNTIINFTRLCTNELSFIKDFDVGKVKGVIEKVLNGDKNEAVIILICQGETPVGVLGCTRFEPLFCPQGCFQAIELLFYILPDSRTPGILKKVLQAYKYWARLVGCSYITYTSYKNGIECSRIRKL